MTGSLIDSRHTEHSSSEPLANTTRSFSINRSRISAGVAEAPKYGVWKILSKNPSCSDAEHKLRDPEGGKKYHRGLQKV